ncbi:MAG TPA: response regulator transcription factor [Polyangiales bacterium]|nr:response regulator transcription factor [Polyangiales bacterium]
MRVLLADDHVLVRAGIRALLEALPDVEVVAEVGDGRAALDQLNALRPDVAFLDIGMPGLNGIEVAERAAREVPATRIVMLSMHSSSNHVTRALRAGAAGYLLKDAAADELPVVLRAVGQGETYLSPAIAKHVVDGFLQRGTSPDSQPLDALDGLTPRQREILQLVAEGRSTKEVAALLELSVKTVETHRSQIMARLDIHDVAGLVRYAIRNGLVNP